MRPLDLPGRFVVGTAICCAVSWAPFACSSGVPVPKVSPETQEALVVAGIESLRDRCSVLFADGDPPASRARDACLVLAAIDRGLMVLEPKNSGTDEAPGLDAGALPVPETSPPGLPGSASPKDRDKADHAPSEPGGTQLDGGAPVVTPPSDAGSFFPVPGNTVRMVRK